MVEALRKVVVVVILTVVLTCFTAPKIVMAEEMLCWFPPGFDPGKAIAITNALSQGTSAIVQVKIARNYPELLDAFAAKPEALVFTGSFTAAVLQARGLAVPLVQKIDGKELYAGVLIYPKGENPAALLNNFPAEISYAVGASSGESSAKAATEGKAKIGVRDHLWALAALKAGNARAAVVKNFWWEANKKNYPEFDMYEIPEISLPRNPDNILMAATAVSEENRGKLTQAAIAGKKAFSANEMKRIEAKDLEFTLNLMRKGGIDPNTYTW